MIALLALLAAMVPDGTYRQACQEGYQREEIFRESEAIYVERNFADSDCVMPSLEVRSYGRLTYGAEVKVPEDAAAIDFEFLRVTMQPNSESVARIYRNKNLCGLSNWGNGKELEITGRHCDLYGVGRFVPVPKVGDVRYGIFRVNADASITFGALTPERNGSVPALRPHWWDQSPFLRIAE